MKKLFLSLVILIFSAGCATPIVHNRLFQVSTLKALSVGVFDGSVDLNTLQKHGNFGIGTFTGLGGELVMLNGQIYKVDYSGNIYQPCKCNAVPLALVTDFNPDIKVEVKQVFDFQQLQQFILDNVDTKNIVYAIRIRGDFEFVKTRSVPQYNKPYPRLAEAVKNQKMFEFNNVKGAMIGFWFPKYFEGINMPGFHFHYLNDNKKLGGHLFDCKIKNGIIEIAKIRNVEVVLPENDDFNKADLLSDNSNEIKQVESSK